MSEIKIELELEPFMIPNYVIVKSTPGQRREGFKENPKYRLSELPDETLIALCSVFQDAVLDKARKERKQ